MFQNAGISFSKGIWDSKEAVTIFSNAIHTATQQHTVAHVAIPVDLLQDMVSVACRPGPFGDIVSPFARRPPVRAGLPEAQLKTVCQALLSKPQRIAVCLGLGAVHAQCGAQVAYACVSGEDLVCKDKEGVYMCVCVCVCV